MTYQAHQIKDEAIILKTHKLGESDRIITLLTRNHGKIRAVAKGVRKPKSKIGASNEPFMRIECVISLSKNLGIISQSLIIDPFAKNICQDYSKYEAACAMVKLLDKMITQDFEPASQLYLLTVRALRMLSNELPQYVTANLVSVSYILRSMSILGYEYDYSYDLKVNDIQSKLLDALFMGKWAIVEELCCQNDNLELQVTQIVAAYYAKIM